VKVNAADSDSAVGRSLTDAVLIFSVFASASFAIIIFPIQDLFSPEPLSGYVKIEHLLGAFLIPLALLVYSLWTLMWRRQQRSLARAMSGSDVASQLPSSTIPELRSLLDKLGVECRIIGSANATDLDSTQELTAPRIVLPGVSHPILIISARTLTRLGQNEEALRAVILHEIGHVLSSDSRRLDDTKRAITIFAWLIGLYTVLSIGTAYHLDCAGSGCGSALLADIAGKGLLTIALLQMLLLLALRSLLDPLRERIADNYVIEQMGDGRALADAEDLISGHQGSPRSHRGALITPSMNWYLIFGAMVGIASTNVGGYLYYIADGVVHTNHPELYRNAADLVIAYVPVFASAWLLLRTFSDDERCDLPRLFRASFLFGIGGWASYVLGHVIPAAVIPLIPEQYSYVIRDDISAIVFDGSTTILSDNLEKSIISACISFAFLVLVRRTLRFWALAIFICTYACLELLERLEYSRLLRLSRFDLYIWSIVILFLAAIAHRDRYTMRAGRLASALCVVSFLIWFGLRISGYHEVSLRTVVTTKEGQKFFDSHDWNLAKKLFQEAHASSPHAPLPLVSLGDAEDKLEHPKAAAEQYDAALALRGWSSWNDRIYAIGHSAGAHVDAGTPEDQRSARRLLLIALKMRRENARLPRMDVAYALGVYSYLLAKYGADEELPLSMLCLAESAVTYPQFGLFSAMLTEPDAARLHLKDGPRYIPPDAEQVFGSDLPSYAEDTWQKAAAHWNLADQEAFARTVAWNAGTSKSSKDR
jgi:Zn-dependent protease with chaperone function